MVKYWIAVVSKQHVNLGVSGGFCQVCHGKRSPLPKMKCGDWLVYYSPRESMDIKSKEIKSFTSIGQMADEEIYSFRMSESFVPFRRNVNYVPSTPTPIRPLLPLLSFTKDRQDKWGMIFRNGLFEISQDDFELIHSKMTS
ncbi:hypothetical protein PPL_09185 [Heterostelium album PN500]|uniref:EVE domain-containing protein n=1 Tax=Heterostelium pallidum (strain ATCC 26659 / Pp 5 / PN500) TaxID=670386 RepID=D3BKV3_HETP5|nr:hypothetical protein PPL_09185 [Heterostelium album PN500]EFA78533.1 hypothetical protein PPL_09185 [Heterostelium album PN500]|eukprot:XP_020430657.1 hypothetical protein PPL_09185 [Heterostelium album PN500]